MGGQGRRSGDRSEMQAGLVRWQRAQGHRRDRCGRGGGGGTPRLGTGAVLGAALRGRPQPLVAQEVEDGEVELKDPDGGVFVQRGPLVRSCRRLRLRRRRSRSLEVRERRRRLCTRWRRRWRWPPNWRGRLRCSPRRGRRGRPPSCRGRLCRGRWRGGRGRPPVWRRRCCGSLRWRRRRRAPGRRSRRLRGSGCPWSRRPSPDRRRWLHRRRRRGWWPARPRRGLRRVAALAGLRGKISSALQGLGVDQGRLGRRKHLRHRRLRSGAAPHWPLREAQLPARPTLQFHSRSVRPGSLSGSRGGG
mmetsp:Transcript_104836/g.333615  ORF Transcript_104836/g.333615 Transcript_104836/m.333615 type:complete len:303 (+) Transcript_104836:314-1222(+)